VLEPVVFAAKFRPIHHIVTQAHGLFGESFHESCSRIVATFTVVLLVLGNPEYLSSSTGT
jgi:hypothetical protein